ncbi:MAG: hypothetical protein KGL39_30360 [Patescibacteria group bacterium]|nr:hypothetical protein [Patescibacteria group bacterium]
MLWFAFVALGFGGGWVVADAINPPRGTHRRWADTIVAAWLWVSTIGVARVLFQ